MNPLPVRVLVVLAVVAFELSCTGNVPVTGGSSADPITVCVQLDGGLCSTEAVVGDADTDDAPPL